MGTAITSFKNTLDADGYVVVRSVAAPRDVEALRAIFPAGDAALKTAHVDDLEEHPGIARVLADPTLAELIGDLLGRDFVLQRVHGREPGAGGGAQGLHADVPGPMVDGAPNVATMFLYLDDADESNGATRIVPGSHRAKHVPDRTTGDPAYRHVAERIVVVRSGDALLFNANVWHSGTRNRTGRRRRSIQFSFRALRSI
jgi:ectoine hydroxylase-related dioxygenase (phytanoyl-CoA dioxygenase family)